jgi:hypothetical protein
MCTRISTTTPSATRRATAARLGALLHRVEALRRICLSSACLRAALRRRSGVDWRRRSAEHLRSCSRNRCWAGLHHEDSIAVTPATAQSRSQVRQPIVHDRNSAERVLGAASCTGRLFCGTQGKSVAYTFAPAANAAPAIVMPTKARLETEVIGRARADPRDAAGLRRRLRARRRF